MWDLPSGRELQCLDLEVVAPNEYIQGAVVYDISFCGDDAKVALAYGLYCYIIDVERGQMVSKMELLSSNPGYLGAYYRALDTDDHAYSQILLVVTRLRTKRLAQKHTVAVAVFC